MRKYIYILICILCLVLASCSGPSIPSQESYSEGVEGSLSLTQDAPENDSNQVQQDAEDPIEGFGSESPAGDLRITLLDVGQGLSVLLESDGHAMIYDGGNRKYSSFIVSYLQNHGISNLDYLFASHYDEDHIAGLVGVLNTVSVDTAVIPYYVSDTKIYDSFMNAVTNANEIDYAVSGSSYSFGDAVVDVLYGCNGQEPTKNDMSSVVKVRCGDFSCIISGDAEYATESYLVDNQTDLDCTLYIVGHHGSSSSSSPAFVRAMSPQVAFIGVGEGNDYGHPAEKTLNTLTENNVEVYRTDTQGTIILDYVDGGFSISTEKNLESGSAQTQSEETSSDGISATYVLNTSSLKFHYPDCEAVSAMSEKNRQEYTGSREDLIEKGFAPCGSCKP